LFKVSPDSSFYPVEPYLRGDFPIGAGFPLGKPSGANESSALTTYANKATKRKPVLLLVEDNPINLKVYLDHALENFFPLIISIRTNSGKASRNLTNKNNYEYDPAENGLLALQALQNTQNLYDIVFMGKQILILNIAAS
jgi:hypothetical protein